MTAMWGVQGEGEEGFFFCFHLTKNIRPQPYFQTKDKKKIRTKIVSATIHILFLTIFRYNCTFLPNFFDPEALRGPSCFFKTLKVLDIIPLVP
jgi:hypothetical protein